MALSAESMPIEDPYSGRTIGKCRIEQLIGRGGHGFVYRAHHQTLDRPVAVKILPVTDSSAPEGVERFLLEARTAAGIDHPNIVRVYDVDRGEGFHYLVMEYVEGMNLHTRVAQGGPIPWPEACRIARDVAGGLAAAHELDPPVIHRDVKPANIMLATDGSVRILDFGLVRPLGARDLTGKTTRILGTPSYIAPENARGERLDPRSDIYSLGVTLFYALAGTKPFEAGTSVEMLYRHVFDPAPSLAGRTPDLPAALVETVGRMIAKRPSDRFASCRELADRLDVLLGERSRPAAPPAPPAPAPVARSGEPSPPEEGPFLGHDVHRRRIRRAIERALAGDPSVIVVAGPRGSGRSRFGRELERSKELDSVLVFTTTGEATLEASLARLAGRIVERLAWMTRTLSAGADRWGPWVLGHVPGLADRPVLSSAAGGTGPSGVFELREALAAFFGPVTTRCPLLLYVDGFDAASEGDWETAAALVEGTAHRLVLALAGAECSAEPAARRRLVEARRFEELRLRPLSSALVRSLLEARLGARASDELVGELHQLSGGNPRDLALLVEAGRESGFVLRDGDAWTTDLAERPGHAEGLLPDAVEDALLLTALALPATHRRALAALSVSPFPLPRESMERVLGVSATQASLVVQALLEARLASRVPGDGDTLALTASKVRARFAAEASGSEIESLAAALLELWGDSVDRAEELALLLEAAGRTEEALAYRAAAGKAALRAGRLERAAEHLEEAVRRHEELVSARGWRAVTKKGFLPALFERPLEGGALRALLGSVWLRLERPERAVRAGEEAARLAQRHGEEASLGEIQRGLGLARLAARDYEGAERSLRAAGGSADPEVLCHRAAIDFVRDRYAEAAAALQAARAALRHGEDPALEALVHHLTGRLAYLRGEWDGAAESARREIEIVTRAGLDVQRPRQQLAWARVLFRRGRIATAHDILSALDRDGIYGVAAAEGMGWAYLLLADPPRALAAFERGLARLAERPDVLAEARLEEGVAAASLALGDAPGAIERSARAQILYESLFCPRGRAAAWHLRARAALARRELQDAELYLGYADLEIARIEAPWRAADLAVTRLEVALAAEDFDEAARHQEEAARLAQRSDDRPVLARLFSVQGEHLRRAGKSGEAEAFFRRALTALR